MTHLSLNECCGTASLQELRRSLSTARAQAEDLHDGWAAQAFDLLLDCLALPLYADRRHDPFGDPTSMQSHARFSTGAFSEEDRQLVSRIMEEVENPHVRARLGDLLWLLHKDHRAGRQAVEAYMQAATSSEALDWPDEVAYLARAASLSKTLGKKEDLHREVLSVVGRLVRQVESETASLRGQRLLILALQYGAAEPGELAGIAATHAQKQSERGHLHCARAYWTVAAECAQSAGDTRLRDRCTQAIIDTHVGEAEAYAANLALGTNFHNAAHCLQRAIEVQRSLPDSRDRVDRLKLRLAEVQKEAAKQLIPLHFSHDLTPVFEEIRKELSGKPVCDALYRLGQLIPLLSKRRLIDDAKAARQRYLLKSLFPKVYLNGQGKVIAREPEEEAEALLAEALSRVRPHQQAMVNVIRFAVDLIMEEHAVTFADVVEAIEDHPFLPRGRLVSVARGLLAGFQNDHLVAVHLLVPQMEHSIRFLLNRMGVPTTGLNTAGIQDEVGLNTLLTDEKYVTPLERVFGENWIFTLRATLVERFGTNVRNYVAHGLEDDVVYQGPEGVFTWALAWKMYSLMLGAAGRQCD
ncbi:DUF4209 domain-containing protein [Deinococcus taklimakanensis]|uniref:DUF4209 domain-containing protein n=1 Tax=Deinococcus taklimakanensis TaxID=536443 RepID=A0ABW5P1L7_9DEIO